MIESMLFSLQNNWILATFLVPLVGMLVRESIARKWACRRIWKKRMFSPGDFVEVYDGAGSWELMKVIDYKFKFFRDVDQYIELIDEEYSIEKIYLLDWNQLRKRKTKSTFKLKINEHDNYPTIDKFEQYR